MPIVLTIEGAGAGQRFQFEQQRICIGRSGGNDVVLSDAGVSRLHARIERRGDAFVLHDESSANGTELNGTKLSSPQALRRGDRIGVGPVVFRFGEARCEGTCVSPPLPLAARKEARSSARQAKPKLRAGMPLRRSIFPRRGLALTAACALLALAGGALVLRERPSPRGTVCPETVFVDERAAAFSFGHASADVDCGSRVAFGFDALPKKRILFHYTPSQIVSPGELEIRLNGRHLGWAPTAPAPGEPQALPLPSELLASGGRNLVSFSQNQPGKEWSVANVRVEMLAIPPGDLQAARAAYDRGRRKLEERLVAPRNLHDAWAAFAEARRQLEGIAPRPPLHDEVSQLVRACERDLERQCGRLVFTAQRFERYGEDERAQQTWREVLLHFPEEDPSGCREKAQANIVPAQAADRE